ncbi:GNAT family N-acetyltransferase [Tahibacter amnicola]|uniref:GNAT family N-acetyltransferase n=1 Tax=Tahibacter amnicola TaxID=2976241 RepID=A0ABY6B8W7_9GAMM|nr:GNAT family N-acetyltransferase [Tahibacter amnicola]UXI66469.1 GNAT family N-acetyltransferase [Tahibacter amnicola]
MSTPSHADPNLLPPTTDISAMALAALAFPGNQPHWIEQLKDGRHVLIRPIHAKDAPLERHFLESLSPATRRMRFLGQVGQFSETFVRQLCDLNYATSAAFIALVHENGEIREVGVSRFSETPDHAACECAVTVADEWQRHGLGTILMRHLIQQARIRGIRTMVSIDLADNVAMQHLARDLGFERRVCSDDHTLVTHALTL